MRTRTRLLACALTLALTAACGPADGPGQRPSSLDVRVQSQRGATSHEAGSNCMTCHQAEGLGKGRFTVAGTAYTAAGAPHANATITLFSGGVSVLTLETDASGNFYSTEPVPVPEQSIFPTVSSGDSGLTIAMPFPTQSGACNMCHVGRQRLQPD
jgi:hypothetical protein